MRIAISGAGGLIGSALARSLDCVGIGIIRLVRRPPASAAEIRWGPAAPDGAINPCLPDRAGRVHLSGAPIANDRWTSVRKLELRTSHIDSTSAMVTALLAASRPPPVRLVASAIGWYGDTGRREVDETALNGTSSLPG